MAFLMTLQSLMRFVESQQHGIKRKSCVSNIKALWYDLMQCTGLEHCRLQTLTNRVKSVQYSPVKSLSYWLFCDLACIRH